MEDGEEVLREVVRGFVGEEDYRERWARAGYAFKGEERRFLVEGFNLLVAGLEDGTTRVRTTAGRALWSYRQAAKDEAYMKRIGQQELPRV